MGRGERLLQTLPDRWREAQRAGAASAPAAGGTCRCWGTRRSGLGPPPAPTGAHMEAAQGGSIHVMSAMGLSQGVLPPPVPQAPSAAID